MPKNNSNSWYTTQKLMAQIDQQELLYYCPLTTNRRVDDSGGAAPYVRVDELIWSAETLQQGKLSKIRGFPRIQEGETFLSSLFQPTEPRSVATNDLAQAATDAVQDVCAVRWKPIRVTPLS